VLEALEAAGGIYVAMFAIGLVSGVFPIVNSELALIGITLSIDSLPTAIILAVIVAVGQVITHSFLFFTARGLTKVTAKRREKLEARIEKARALVDKWGNKWLLLMTAAATLGVPPMILVALAAGALGVRYRTLIAIDLTGRIARFIVIAIGASYF
jgi:membrane protein YqaA with SNARE-associated domain